MGLSRGAWGWCVAFALMAPACTSTVQGSGADLAPTVAGGCGGRSGLHSIQWTSRSQITNCGALSSQVFDPNACDQVFCQPFSNRNKIGATRELFDDYEGCIGTITITADNCGSTFKYFCEQPDGRFQAMIQGAVTWAADGKSATGTMDVTYFAQPLDEVDCIGEYSVAVQRQ